MDLILFGRQGSGKGTQSQIIAQRCGLHIFEAGAQLRRLAKEESELGHKVKSIIESGNLVPTEVVMEIIHDFIQNLPEGQAVLFDGIPRSMDQMEQLDELMQKEGRDFKGVLINISEEEALKRLTTRRICTQCKAVYPAFYTKEECEKCGGELQTRKDDTPDAIRVRLDTYTEKTLPVIQAYQSQNKLVDINGEQSIEDVTKDVLDALKADFPCQ